MDGGHVRGDGGTGPRGVAAMAASDFDAPDLVVGLRDRAAIGLLLSAPGQSNVRFGQVSVFVVVAALADAVDVVPARWRGVLVGVAAAVKLTPLLFVVLFAITGRWREACRALAAFVGCAAVAAIVLPRDSWTFWSSAMFATSRIGDLVALGNQSVNGILLRAGLGDPWLEWSWAGSLVLVCGAALWRARALYRAGLGVHAAVLAGCATVAASPVSWTHHQFWIVLAAMLLAAGPTRWHQWVGTTLWAVMTVDLATVLARLRVAERILFLAANVRGLAAAAFCVFGFGALTARRDNPEGRQTSRERAALSARALIMTAVATLVFAIIPLPADANLGIGGSASVHIVFATLHGDATEVNRELRARHLAVSLQFLAASPSLVNMMLGSSASENVRFQRLVFEYSPGTMAPGNEAAVTIPGDLRGDLVLFIGRRARSGENYASMPVDGAESPGETLSCHRVTGLRVSQALREFKAAGVSPIWNVDADHQTAVVDRLPRNSLYIDDVLAINARQVIVHLSSSRPALLPQAGSSPARFPCR